MTEAFERAAGHLLLVLVVEVLFVVLVLQDPGAWYDGRWGALVAFALGGLGLPWTIPVPHLITQGGGGVPVAILMVAPLVNLFLRLMGYYLRADGAKVT